MSLKPPDQLEKLQQRCVAKRRLVPTTGSICCTTRCIGWMSWLKRTGGAVETAEPRAWTTRHSPTSRSTAGNGGWENWRKSCGRRRISRKPFCGNGFRRQTESSGRWAFQRFVTVWVTVHDGHTPPTAVARVARGGRVTRGALRVAGLIGQSPMGAAESLAVGLVAAFVGAVLTHRFRMRLLPYIGRSDS